MNLPIDLDVQKIIYEDGAILHTVTRDSRGRLHGKSNVYACIEVDGVRYKAERQVRVAFRKI